MPGLSKMLFCQTLSASYLALPRLGSVILGHNLWGHKSSFVRICEIYDSQEGQCHPKGLSWNFVLK